MQGFSSNYTLTTFCQQNSLDNTLEVFVMNSAKRLEKVKDLEKLNRTVVLMAKSLENIIKGFLKGCEIDLKNEGETNLEGSLKKGLETFNSFSSEIANFDGDYKKLVGETGKVIGFLYKIFEKNLTIYSN